MGDGRAVNDVSPNLGHLIPLICLTCGPTMCPSCFLLPPSFGTLSSVSVRLSPPLYAVSPCCRESMERASAAMGTMMRIRLSSHSRAQEQVPHSQSTHVQPLTMGDLCTDFCSYSLPPQGVSRDNKATPKGAAVSVTVSGGNNNKECF